MVSIFRTTKAVHYTASRVRSDASHDATAWASLAAESDPARLQRGTNSELPEFFCIPPIVDDGANYRRLADSLGAQWTVWLVRPDMAKLARKELYGLEEVADQLLGEIQSRRTPGKPFLVAGYCLGGVIAFKVAQRFSGDGCLGLILFDTPIPGFPHPYRSLGYLRHFVWVLRERRKAQGNFSAQERLTTTFKRRITWHALAHTRPLLRYIWRRPYVQTVAAKARLFDLDFFVPLGRLRLPALHFVSAPGPDILYNHTRMFWHHHIRGPFRLIHLQNGHEGVFFRNNLPTIAEGVRSWVAALPR